MHSTRRPRRDGQGDKELAEGTLARYAGFQRREATSVGLLSGLE